MTSITWAGPRYVQELGTFLGSQNRTQRRCVPVFNLPYYGSLQRQLLWNEGEILDTSYVKMLCYENKFPLLFIVMFRDCTLYEVRYWRPDVTVVGPIPTHAHNPEFPALGLYN